MIPAFVHRFDASRDALRARFRAKPPEDYLELFKATIEAITVDEFWDFAPDPERITKIDHGDYQGVLVFVVAEKGYQPRTYYYVRVDYGSCSGCDTLESIKSSNYKDDVSDEQAAEYLTLALHIVLRMKNMDDPE